VCPTKVERLNVHVGNTGSGVVIQPWKLSANVGKWEDGHEAVIAAEHRLRRYDVNEWPAQEHIEFTGGAERAAIFVLDGVSAIPVERRAVVDARRSLRPRLHSLITFDVEAVQLRHGRSRE
jgi:hypothetical protein